MMKTGLKLSTPTGGGCKPHPRKLLFNEDENHPPPSSPSPSKMAMVKQLTRSRTPLEDHDPNSQDSGYALSEDSKSPASFRFAEPSGFAPKRLSSMESPARRNLLTSSFTSSDSNQSTGSTLESQDDGFLEMFQAEKLDDEEMEMSGNLKSLVSDPIVMQKKWRKSPDKRGLVRRCMSMSESENRESVKRPLTGGVVSPPPQYKRHKPLTENTNIARGTLFQYGFTKGSAPLLPTKENQQIQRHLSIELALQRSTQEDLIGDFSRPFALPLMPGKHQDLKTISSETLAKLISGDFNDRISSFKIIDCRYPYEYDGGHIKGAVNLYTQEQIKKELVETRVNPPIESDKRHILVFHCEFSSERGPRMSRYLRKEDRAGNTYPALHYPELYLLHGGYQAFFQEHSTLCEPCSYRPMHDPAHSSDLKQFRSKSWSASSSHRRPVRSLSRLGF